MLTRRSALLASCASPLAHCRPPPSRVIRAAGTPGAGAQAARRISRRRRRIPPTTPIGPVDTTAQWAFIQDFTTGAALLDKDADDQMPPSSMTKLMTIYIVYERLKQGKLKLDDQLLVCEKAWRMGGSKMFVQIGTQVRVEDLIRGIDRRFRQRCLHRAGRRRFPARKSSSSS